MKNPKILLIALGGVTVLVALVFAWLIWSGSTERAEVVESLDDAIREADRLTRLPVRPCAASVRAVNSNAAVYATWRSETLKAIARGDRSFDAVTPPAFKTFLVAEAHRLSALPGSAEGKIVKPDFPFGFKDYITGGVLPAIADLPRLQREWSDIATVVELLATNGVNEILDVRVAAAAVQEQEDPKEARRKARMKKSVKPAEEFKPDVSRFEIDFLARPEAFVGAVNSFVASPRYIVVNGFTFVREKDVLVEELGGEEKKAAAAAAAGGRRARRRAQAQADQKEAEPSEVKKGVVIDPLTAPPLKVSMKFSVYDFRTAGVRAEEVSK